MAAHIQQAILLTHAEPMSRVWLVDENSLRRSTVKVPCMRTVSCRCTKLARFGNRKGLAAQSTHMQAKVHVPYFSSLNRDHQLYCLTTMRLRYSSLRQQLQKCSQHSPAVRLSFTRTLATQPFLRDAQQRPTSDEAQPAEDPKATVRSRIVAFLIGSSIALSYAWYRRQNGASTQSSSQADGFTKYTLIDKEDTSSTCSIFTLQPLSKQSRLSKETSLETPAITSILLKQPQLQIARAYTCLPPIPGQPEDSIRLLIRREEKGEVSGYLHALVVGADVEVRGFHEDFVFPTNTAEVIFLAGGTGISPALKTANVLRERAKTHILWANRTREECTNGISDNPVAPSLLSSTLSFLGISRMASKTGQDHDDTVGNTIVLLLDLIKRQSNAGGEQRLTVDYYVDEEGSFIQPASVTKLLHRTRHDGDGAKLIIVSGPAGFIKYWAGPKQWIDGMEQQGPLQGALSKMNLQGWSVVKL